MAARCLINGCTLLYPWLEAERLYVDDRKPLHRWLHTALVMAARCLIDCCTLLYRWWLEAEGLFDDDYTLLRRWLHIAV